MILKKYIEIMINISKKENIKKSNWFIKKYDTFIWKRWNHLIKKFNILINNIGETKRITYGLALEISYLVKEIKESNNIIKKMSAWNQSISNALLHDNSQPQIPKAIMKTRIIKKNIF